MFLWFLKHVSLVFGEKGEMYTNGELLGNSAKNFSINEQQQNFKKRFSP